MTAHDSHEHGSDRSAAFTGLIVAALVILTVLGTIVKLTNAKYSHEKPAAEAGR
jgi:hypothetical protein